MNGSAALTISPDYLIQQQTLHQRQDYGIASLFYADIVAKVIRHFRIKTLSDYGAGKCRLKQKLDEFNTDVDYFPFDPAFPQYGDARSAELVCCIDVLEHVEPQFLDNVLDHLRRLTTGVGFFTVTCTPAIKFLSDGRNAHLIVEPISWWASQLQTRFEVIQQVMFDVKSQSYFFLVR